MKKNQVNSILIDQARRKNKIIGYICCILTILITVFFIFFVYLNRSKNNYITYDESSNIDYKVYLNENSFFEGNYLDMDNKYIASLIDYITASFNYKISLDSENTSINYKYRIEGVIDVKESSSDTKSLYNKTITLHDEVADITNDSTISINEDLKIDYNEYNDLIKTFVNTYSLEDVSSTLTINMYVDVVGSCDDFESDKKETSVISLTIPLTTQTVEIDIKDNLVNEDNNILLCSDYNPAYNVCLVMGIVLLFISLLLIIDMIRYIVVTRSAETIYEINLKKILNNYHSYIQKISNKMEVDENLGIKSKNKATYKDCQFYRLETFTDMLEIRDSINAPILMFENKDDTATYFMILDINNKAVYIYALRVTDIRKSLKK